MAPFPNNCLRNLMKDLMRHCHSDQSLDKSFIVQVLGIFRQLADTSTEANTGVSPAKDGECYEILISDGHYKVKCVLHPDCNKLVQYGQVTIGSLVQLSLSNMKLHMNETDLSATSLVILNNLLVHQGKPVDLLDEDVPFALETCSRDVFLPMATKRGCYLSLWCSEDPFGSQWKDTVQPFTGTIDFSKIVSLQHLTATWKTATHRGQVLLVRVLHKSRLRFYGKACTNLVIPYQAYIEVADRTGVASAVFWTSMCTDFYNCIHEGDVLLLSHFSVKARYQIMSKPTLRHTGLPRLPIEISVNHFNQTCPVRLVPPDIVHPDWRLPSLKFTFINSKHLGSLPDEFNVDVAGVVTYVGRYMRIQKPQSPAEMWCSRWIHLHDSSSTQPIIINTFATSQPSVHRRLKPGCVCILTQLRLRHNLPFVTSSRQSRSVFLTTTNESQISIYDRHAPAQLWSEAVPQEVIRWRGTFDSDEILSESQVVGYYSYPPLPSSLAEYKKCFTDSGASFLVTPASEVASVIQNLRFRETQRLVVQGWVVKVQYVPVGGQAQSKQLSPDDSTGCNTMPIRSSSRIRAKLQSAAYSNMKNKSAKTKRSPVKQRKRQLPKPPNLQVMVNQDISRQVIEALTTIGSLVPKTVFLPRCFDAAYEEDILEAINFPENPSGKAWTEDILEKCPVAPSSAGYFVLTLSSLNLSHLLLTLLPAPARVHLNSTMLSMLSGDNSLISDCEYVPLEKDVLKEILESSKDLKQQRLVFVLDVYNPGAQEVEVVINRAFPVAVDL